MRVNIVAYLIPKYYISPRILRIPKARGMWMVNIVPYSPICLLCWTRTSRL